MAKLLRYDMQEFPVFRDITYTHIYIYMDHYFSHRK